jgi:hypothetical protein
VGVPVGSTRFGDRGSQVNVAQDDIEARVMAEVDRRCASYIAATESKMDRLDRAILSLSKEKAKLRDSQLPKPSAPGQPRASSNNDDDAARETVALNGKRRGGSMDHGLNRNDPSDVDDDARLAALDGSDDDKKPVKEKKSKKDKKEKKEKKSRTKSSEDDHSKSGNSKSKKTPSKDSAVDPLQQMLMQKMDRLEQDNVRLQREQQMLRTVQESDRMRDALKGMDPRALLVQPTSVTLEPGTPGNVLYPKGQDLQHPDQIPQYLARQMNYFGYSEGAPQIIRQARFTDFKVLTTQAVIHRERSNRQYSESEIPPMTTVPVDTRIPSEYVHQLITQALEHVNSPPYATAEESCARTWRHYRQVDTGYMDRNTKSLKREDISKQTVGVPMYYELRRDVEEDLSHTSMKDRCEAWVKLILSREKSGSNKRTASTPESLLERERRTAVYTAISEKVFPGPNEQSCFGAFESKLLRVFRALTQCNFPPSSRIVQFFEQLVIGNWMSQSEMFSNTYDELAHVVVNPHRNNPLRALLACWNCVLMTFVYIGNSTDVIPQLMMEGWFPQHNKAAIVGVEPVSDGRLDYKAVQNNQVEFLRKKIDKMEAEAKKRGDDKGKSDKPDKPGQKEREKKDKGSDGVVKMAGGEVAIPKKDSELWNPRTYTKKDSEYKHLKIVVRKNTPEEGPHDAKFVLTLKKDGTVIKERKEYQDLCFFHLYGECPGGIYCNHQMSRRTAAPWIALGVLSFQKTHTPAFLNQLPECMEVVAAQQRATQSGPAKSHFAGCTTVEDHLRKPQFEGTPAMINDPDDFAKFSGISCTLRVADVPSATGALATRDGQIAFRMLFGPIQGKSLPNMISWIKTRKDLLQEHVTKHGPPKLYTPGASAEVAVTQGSLGNLPPTVTPGGASSSGLSNNKSNGASSSSSSSSSSNDAAGANATTIDDGDTVVDSEAGNSSVVQGNA